MSINWVIETAVEKDGTRRLIESVKKFGRTPVEVKLLPFSNNLTIPITLRGDYIFYGSLSGARLARQQGLRVIEDERNLLCQKYYTSFKGLVLNEPAVFSPYGLLAEIRSIVFDVIASDGCLFIRPDSNRKIFNGELISEKNWGINSLPKLNFIEKPQPEDLVVIAPPVNIIKEWRFFVVDDEVITGSLYREGRRLKKVPATEEELDMAKVMLSSMLERDYPFDFAWVLDICKTRAGRIKVLEIGGFSSAGLYAADTDRIVEAINNLF